MDKRIFIVKQIKNDNPLKCRILELCHFDCNEKSFVFKHGMVIRCRVELVMSKELKSIKEATTVFSLHLACLACARALAGRLK
jgi:hypothetical protein